MSSQRKHRAARETRASQSLGRVGSSTPALLLLYAVGMMDGIFVGALCIVEARPQV
jgi:hypothetical protein